MKLTTQKRKFRSNENLEMSGSSSYQPSNLRLRNITRQKSVSTSQDSFIYSHMQPGEIMSDHVRHLSHLPGSGVSTSDWLEGSVSSSSDVEEGGDSTDTEDVFNYSRKGADTIF